MGTTAAGKRFNPKTLFIRGRLPLAIAAAALAASGLGSSAWAQGEKPKGYNLQLEEVMVTAQKREENYMDVPITVNAFTAQDMINTGAVNIQDIDDFMPGVDVSDDGTTQVSIAVRGVSSPNISSGQDPSVATFYDGSYMPRAVTSIPFTDIARTEVLKGPQGTLFGRNATAGVINIVPNAPVNEFEGFVKSRLGNYDLVRLEGMVNAPVTDALALRANIFSHQRDGITENVGIGGNIRDEKFLAARLVGLYTLSERTDIQLSYDMEDRNEQPREAIGVGKYAYLGSLDPFSGKAANDVVGQEETRDMYGVAAKLNHSFNEQLSLFGIVSYRDWKTTNLEDEDGTEEPRRYFDSNNIEESDIWYSEARLNYIADKLNLIVGGNYSAEDVYQRTDIHTLADSYMQFVSVQAGLGQDEHLWDIFGDNQAIYELLSADENVAVLPPSFAGQLIPETIDNTGDFINWGVFADATYQLTDTLRLAAGLRYSYDDKEYSWQTFPVDIDWPWAPARLAYDPAQTGADPADYYDKFTDKQDWSKTTGRLVMDWQFSDAAMTYLSYATGYKSGGFDGQQFSAYVAGPFDPEEMTSIEWGLKGDFFDQTLRLETAVFYHDLDGRQTTADTKQGPDDPTAQPTVISSDENSQGVELIVQWQALENLMLTGMTTVRDTESTPQQYYDSAGELAGGKKTNSKTNSDYTLRLDWTPDIPVGYLLIHADYVFIEAADPDAPGTVIYVEGPWYFRDQELLSARIAWQDESDTFEVALWGRNLLDREVASNPGGYVADYLGAAHTNIQDPLTWGVDLRYSF